MSSFLRIGSFTVLRTLPRGSLHRIDLCLKHVATDIVRVMVVKRPRVQVARLPGVAERLLHEARLTMMLGGEGRVQAFEAGTDEGGPYVAMEYLPGPSAHDLIERKKAGKAVVTQPQALALAGEAVKAILHADELSLPADAPRLIMFDPSPQHWMLGIDGKVRLVDFAVAQKPGSDDLKIPGERRSLLALAPPEQRLGGAASGQGTVYTLALALGQLLGLYVFEPIKTDDAHRLANFSGNTTALQPLFSAALHADPSRRPSLATFSRELEALRTPAGTQSLTSLARLTNTDLCEIYRQIPGAPVDYAKSLLDRPRLSQWLGAVFGPEAAQLAR